MKIYFKNDLCSKSCNARVDQRPLRSLLITGVLGHSSMLPYTWIIHTIALKKDHFKDGQCGKIYPTVSTVLHVVVLFQVELLRRDFKPECLSSRTLRGGLR